MDVRDVDLDRLSGMTFVKSNIEGNSSPLLISSKFIAIGTLISEPFHPINCEVQLPQFLPSSVGRKSQDSHITSYG